MSRLNSKRRIRVAWETYLLRVAAATSPTTPRGQAYNMVMKKPVDPKYLANQLKCPFCGGTILYIIRTTFNRFICQNPSCMKEFTT